ncbi:related to Peroxisomal membrane protein PEX30 [Saccharomycodes ludwigii]|uniref:Related to Peroxisomal membrane protein PEX30 n=1 Tax=Saccharomycodes ludwigii TaxID=36035 RepID=A0A376B569_9ASCO|nr:hypothetical protein SCDLUD_001464 [Saccharomycodes ludwigii]KAH3901693.1 hypothetical protein SCDLUD_001464 [Saccharomycodes ludwigii]SSD59280.1 related to Peroxisomal membrane protein PEX30 [Saccharomycodes ludwigii]
MSNTVAAKNSPLDMSNNSPMTKNSLSNETSTDDIKEQKPDDQSKNTLETSSTQEQPQSSFAANKNNPNTTPAPGNPNNHSESNKNNTPPFESRLIDPSIKKRAVLLDGNRVSNSERLGFNHRAKTNKDRPLRGVLKKNVAVSSLHGSTTAASTTSNNTPSYEIIQSSPLLTSTPPSISRSLIRLYPYLIVFDKVLGLLTWTNDNIWGSVLLLCVYITINLYFQQIITYFGHLTIVILLWLYSMLDKNVGEEMELHPTLDDIIYIVSSVAAKFDLLFSPITVLTTQDIKRVLITTIFLSPFYMLITIFFLPKEKLVLIIGIFFLTYHSSWSKVTRALMWKFKIVRLLAFYITGLDIDGINRFKKRNGGLFSAVHKKLLKTEGYNSIINGTNGGGNGDNDYINNKPIRFTYVLYENQRRWLGIGWKPNMLSYERAAWTDEFLNEAPEPDQFKLPDDSSSGMIWRWVDKTWRLDLTNDGAIQLPSSKPKTTATPNSDEGFIYYDNTWKKPSTEDTYTKYTRRRRWVRTAELIKVSDALLPQPSSAEATTQPQQISVEVGTSSGVATSATSLSSRPVTKRRVSFSSKKNIRVFDEDGSIKEDNDNPERLSSEDDTCNDSDLGKQDSSKKNDSLDDGEDKNKQKMGEQVGKST